MRRPGALANRMRVAECEIVFRFDRTLAPRVNGYARAEVLAAVASLHPGIEAPDSRFIEFERAGEAQLIADCACANEMVVGPAVRPDARIDALVGLVNELGGAGQTIEAHQFVTTGACVPPIPVLPGQQVEADFGWIGRIRASFV
jgi:2-keto-4-pentenoate hydratase